MDNFIEKQVTYKNIDESSVDQKIDNYLIKIKNIISNVIYNLKSN